MGWKNTLICIAIAIIGVFGINPLISSFDIFLTYIGYNLATSLPLPLSNFGYLVLNILLLAVVPAILEELIFRGVIFNGYRKFGAIKAILISSALFALIHGSLQQLLFPFLFGLILSFTAYKTGSVISSMIIHFINNATVVVLNYINFNFAIDLPTWSFVLISIILCALTFVVVWLLGKLLKNVDKAQTFSEEEQLEIINMKNNEVISNFPIVLGVILGALFLVIDILSGLGVIVL